MKNGKLISRWLGKEHKGGFQNDGNALNHDWMAVTQMNTSVKIHRTGHLKYRHFAYVRYLGQRYKSI